MAAYRSSTSFDSFAELPLQEEMQLLSCCAYQQPDLSPTRKSRNLLWRHGILTRISSCPLHRSRLLVIDDTSFINLSVLSVSSSNSTLLIQSNLSAVSRTCISESFSQRLWTKAFPDTISPHRASLTRSLIMSLSMFLPEYFLVPHIPCPAFLSDAFTLLFDCRFGLS